MPDLNRAAGAVLGPNHGAVFKQGRTLLQPHERAGTVFIGPARIAEVDQAGAMRAEATVLKIDVGPAEQLHRLNAASEQATFQSDRWAIRSVPTLNHNRPGDFVIPPR